jgi:hypothetical protein
MDRFIPVLVWVVSAFICYYIAKKRGVEPSLLWNIVVVFLGPFAIPLMFLAKPAVQEQAQ